MGKIILKYSDVPGKIPLATDLDPGELALNSIDGALFTNANGAVKQIGDLTDRVKTETEAGIGDKVQSILALTQAEYDAVVTKQPDKLYVIVQ